MKRKIQLQLLLIPTVFILLLVFIFLSANNSNTNSDFDKINDFIKVDTLSKRVILVRMGYDAVTAINSQQGIVIIDAGISNSLTSKYRNIIEQEFKKDHFKYLINTHSHWDHTGGNQVFSDAKIVGQRNCINEINEDTKNPEEKKKSLLRIISQYKNQIESLEDDSEQRRESFYQKLRYQLTYNDWQTNRIITYPELTFSDTMNINMGDMNLNLIYFGKAHSGSDILIHIPEEKLLFTGDLFFKYGRPSIGSVNKVDVERWLIVKKWIIDRFDNINIVIGGHGQILGKNDLQDFNKYIDEKWTEVK